MANDKYRSLHYYDELINKCVVNTSSNFLEEEVNNGVNWLISEEFGLLNIIQTTADRIKEQIKKEIYYSEPYIGDQGIPEKSGAVYTNMQNVRVNIFYNVFFFKSAEEYRQMQSKCGIGAYTTENGGYITLNASYVRGKLKNDTFGNSLQHELFHLFDIAKHNFNRPYSKSQNNLYSTACKIITSNMYSLEERKVAKLLYLNLDTEQIAHANGLDNELRENPDTIRTPQIYREYQYLYDFREVVYNYKKYRNFAQYFGLTEEMMLSKLRDAYNNYARRISRVIAYHQNNIIENNK